MNQPIVSRAPVVDLSASDELRDVRSQSDDSTADLSKTDLLRAYRTMILIRTFEERLHVENAKGDIPGFLHLYAGQEAIATGVCQNLTDNDHIGSTHRGHGHCIAKGCDVQGMMSEIFGRKTGLCQGKGGSMHIAELSKGMLGANGIVGGAPPLSIGAALMHKTLKTGGVAVSFGGDGSSNQGTTFEAMNMAVVLKLPCVFVIENNGYGEGTGCDYAVGSRDIADRAGAFGMPAVRVDGTDFFAVYKAAQACIERARNGAGPSTIEAAAMRYFGHFEGDPMHYRGETEVADLRAHRDPIVLFRKRTEAVIPAEEFSALDDECARLIDECIHAARAAAFPVPERDLLRDVYVKY